MIRERKRQGNKDKERNDLFITLLWIYKPYLTQGFNASVGKSIAGRVKNKRIAFFDKQGIPVVVAVDQLGKGKGCPVSVHSGNTHHCGANGGVIIRREPGSKHSAYLLTPEFPDPFVPGTVSVKQGGVAEYGQIVFQVRYHGQCILQEDITLSLRIVFRTAGSLSPI